MLGDVAIAEEIYRQPDSTLALSCFDQALQQAAKAGKIFSDVPSGIFGISLPDITTGLDAFEFVTAFIPGTNTSIRLDTLGNTIGYLVAPSVADFLANFARSWAYKLSGIIGGALDYLFRSLSFGSFLNDLLTGLFSIFSGGGDDFDCDSMQTLWDELMGNGVNSEAPFFTLSEMLNGNIPNAGDVLILNLERGTGRTVRQSAIDALDLKPGDVPYFVKIPTFTGDESVDDVIGKME